MKQKASEERGKDICRKEVTGTTVAKDGARRALTRWIVEGGRIYLNPDPLLPAKNQDSRTLRYFLVRLGRMIIIILRSQENRGGGRDS